MNPLVAFPGGWELVLIVLVILLLFGAKKLPELARGTGRALRIFKTETKGLTDDDEDDDADDESAEAGHRPPVPPQRELEAPRDTAHPAGPTDPVAREQRDGTTS